jgi:Fic family protein
MFNPQYKLTNKIVSWLSSIAEARLTISRAKLLPKQELRLRRYALVRMSHASTSIEGNGLNIHQVEAVIDQKKVDAPARDIYEVENYIKAMRFISQVVKGKKTLNERMILKIHKLVTDKTLPQEKSGHYRTGSVYVVRRRLGQPQEVMYAAPAAKQVPLLIKNLITWIQESEKQEIHPVVVAGIVHAEIAAIHPFADGNGRTARALATLVLYNRVYDFRRLFALEDYYNKDRTKYYAAINQGKTYQEKKKDLTVWLEYFVKGFKEEILNVQEKVASLRFAKGDDIDSQIYLEKEQVLILDFLEKLGKITVNDVVDILECPKRTAQLWLQRLKKLKLIKQEGKGRASHYKLVK